MAAPAFFVPLAIAGAKIFFKFASKRAAQTFKSNYAKAGQITTKAPPKNATVTTTGSAKGKSVLKDLKSPVTAPSVRARNPNTTTLPKKPKGGGGGKAAGAAATAAGVATGSTTTGKDADKPKKNNRSTSQGGRSRDQVIEQRQEALARKGGASLTRIKKTTSGQMTDAQRKSQGAGVSAKKKMTTPTPPPKRPKKSTKVTKPMPKMYTAINTRTGKPNFDAPKVTEAERLKQEDAYKQFRTLQTDIIKSKLSEAEKKKKKKKKKMNKGGAALKAVPAGNPGLKKLPSAVRNRMGFMRKGGVAKKK